jgi:hypothetical protein
VTLRFARHRTPRTLGDLTAIEQDQLVAAAKAYDGRDCSAQDCLPVDGGDEEQGLYRLELWDVEDDAGAPAYAVWIYQVDSGTIFAAGTTTQVGAFIQFGLECADDVLASALGAAHKAHASWPAECALKGMSLP